MRSELQHGITRLQTDLPLQKDLCPTAQGPWWGGLEQDQKELKTYFISVLWEKEITPLLLLPLELFFLLSLQSYIRSVIMQSKR